MLDQGEDDAIMPTEILDADDVRAIVRDELARPEYVHQRIVEAVCGLPRRDYLRLAREGAWPSTRERRLVLARTADVMAYVERRITLRDVKPSNDHDAEAVEFSRVGARRVAR
jgi:hypothetical protein